MPRDKFKTLEFLAHVFELRANEALRTVTKITKKEDQIQGELSATRKLNTPTALMKAETADFQRVGGDLLWSAWLHAATRKLNMELAKAHVEKVPARKIAQTNMARSEIARLLRDVEFEKDATKIEKLNAKKLHELIYMGNIKRNSCQ